MAEAAELIANKKSRRVWIRPEEEELIVHLKWLVAAGWRVDNAFRTGYLEKLKELMKVKFPNENITGSKHINSKLTVWKKLYGDLKQMVDTSGFGWNSITKMIDVENDGWEKYVKMYPSVKNMRRKYWCFYEDWCLIFGKDRANGEHAAGFEEVVSEHAGTHEPIYPFSMGYANPSPDKGDEVTSNSPGVGAETNSPGVGTEINSPEVGTQTTGPSHSNQTNRGKKKTRGTKRTVIEAGVQSEKVVGIMEQYLEHYKEFSNNLASKIATPSTAQDVVAEKTGKIVDIMEEMQEIPHAERVYLTFKIANSPTHADVFLKMSPISRSFFIQGIRSGSL